jgi:hypothetical protein
MPPGVNASPRAVAAVGVGAAAVIVVVALTALAGPSTPPSRATVSASPAMAPTPSASVVVASRPEPSVEVVVSPSAIPTPALLAGVADLTGETVDDARAHRLPIGVLIDDNAVARPQSGFNGASIVVQAPADGGETRYMLIFQDGDSSDVGPVRSGRIYFVHWISELRGAVAHYGGDALTRAYLLARDGRDFTDVDALRTTSKPFHRIPTRKPPHNAYTSTVKLRAALRGLGGPVTMPADIARRTFVDPAPLDARGTRQTIRIPYGTGLVTYAYDRASDLYRRSVAGRSQIDPADGKRVTTRNVVVLFMSFHIDSTIEPGHARPVLGDIGSGKALVFRDGRVTLGTWQKASETAPTRLLDSAGAEISLVRGRTFIQVVPAGLAVRTDPPS